ncbi:MAG: polysaccharide biosynthesis/export family protein [Dysgonamonadaceae bacterium]|jgi:polysaccharide export outer membrane protein|nr:polysaccharide biosynthesis/export family protein [Dysgonamonadaceae bacterium]
MPAIPVHEYMEEPKIFPNNILRITVSSANVLDSEVREQFNLMPLVALTPASATTSSTDMRFQNYLVDKNGEITYPVLGKIKVEGMTSFELQELLTGKLTQYITHPVVNVSFSNNKIKVLGEVRSPGIYVMGDEKRYSILDAIANAGDITLSGDKKTIKLLRKNPEKEEMEATVLDLTSTDVFASPYFYLQQNDIVIVEPNETRKKDSKFGMQDNYRLSVISTIMGSISLVTTTVITIISLSNNNK